MDSDCPATSRASRFPRVFTGGYRAGLINASWPLASLEVMPSQLVLHGLMSSYTFPIDQIVRLSIYKGLFARGLCIDHRVAGYSPAIVFWTFRIRELVETLEEAGFAVSGVAPTKAPERNET